MREIKFRAWDGEKMHSPIEWSDNGVLYPNEYIYDNCPNKGDLGLLYNIGRGGVEMLQWTGLVDKKGVEIYEGDVVKTKNSKYKVIFDKCCFWGVDELGKYPIYQIRNYVLDDERFEVIGNIYENPELLEEW